MDEPDGKLSQYLAKIQHSVQRHIQPLQLVTSLTKPSFHHFIVPLASCLINAQALLAHRTAQATTSLLAAQGHDLMNDWSLPSAHFVDS